MMVLVAPARGGTFVHKQTGSRVLAQRLSRGEYSVGSIMFMLSKNETRPYIVHLRLPHL
jgi:hypothetical protein